MQNIVSAFRSQISALDDYVVLLIEDSFSYQKTNIEILKILISNQKTPGVYITLSKPYHIMQRLMKARGIDERLVIFIDAFTLTNDGSAKKIPNCLFVGSPEKLSDITLAIDQAVKSLHTKTKFLFFDSLTTLAAFNSQHTVARFLHYLVSRMREWKAKGIIVAFEKDLDERSLNQISQLCDATLTNKKQSRGGI